MKKIYMCIGVNGSGKTTYVNKQEIFELRFTIQ